MLTSYLEFENQSHKNNEAKQSLCPDCLPCCGVDVSDIMVKKNKGVVWKGWKSHKVSKAKPPPDYLPCSGGGDACDIMAEKNKVLFADHFQWIQKSNFFQGYRHEISFDYGVLANRGEVSSNIYLDGIGKR